MNRDNTIKKVHYYFVIALTWFVVGVMMSSCSLAPKKIVVPEYEEPEVIPPPVKTVKVEPEEPLKPIPEVLESTSLEQDVKYRKEERLGQEYGVEEKRAPVVESVGKAESQVKTTRVLVENVLPERKYLVGRLTGYQKSLQSWNSLAERRIAFDVGLTWPQRWHECIQGLEYMVFGYRQTLQMIDLLSQTGSTFDTYDRNPWDIVQRDIRYLESGCPEVFDKGTQFLDDLTNQDAQSNSAAYAKLIDRYLVGGEFQKVIDVYENAQSLLQPPPEGFSVHIAYAEALLKLGQTEAGLEFMADLFLQEGYTEQKGVGFFLPFSQALSRYADLLFVSGEAEQAQKVYGRLESLVSQLEEQGEWVTGQLHFLNDYLPESGEYKAYQRLMKEYISYDGRSIPQQLLLEYEAIMSQHQDLSLKSRARNIIRLVEKRARQWGKETLQEADFLAQEKDFDNARRIIDSLKGVPEDVMAEVRKLNRTIAVLEQEELQRQEREEEEALAVRWEEAVSLLESGRYEKAIGLLSLFTNTQYSDKARLKQGEAVQKLTAQMRKEAADIFVQALRQKDAILQEEMLVRSRQILERIVEEYPEAEIIPKVQRNLQAVEAQIKTIVSQGHLAPMK